MGPADIECDLQWTLKEKKGEGRLFRGGAGIMDREKEKVEKKKALTVGAGQPEWGHVNIEPGEDLGKKKGAGGELVLLSRVAFGLD